MNPNASAPSFSKPSYVLGFLTASFLIFVVLAFAAWRAGIKIRELPALMRTSVLHQKLEVEKVAIPNDVLQDLIALDAVVDNANNPTHAKKHDTILAQPDDELSFKLRPNKNVTAWILKSTDAFNFDPPVLYIEAGRKLTPRVEQFIKENSRLSFTISTDELGCRRTLPAVDSPNKLLVAGSSVAFGSHVNDDQTLPSQLQKLAGARLRVINSGVANYDGQLAFKAANKFSRAEKFAGLVFIASGSNFLKKDRAPLDELRDVLAKFASISDRFDRRVVVTFHTHIYYGMHDIFRDKGWTAEVLRKVADLRAAMPEECRKHGFTFVDLEELEADYQRDQNSFLAPFALFSDHCHYSPLGNRLAAERVFKALEKPAEGGR
jgi:hypothetical protein